MKKSHFDVVIIGGGCAGASTALALLQKGITQIAIIEKSDFSNQRVGETIQPPTSELLKQLGIWDTFIEQVHLPASGVASAWGTSELEYTDFIFKTFGKGWHLDRNAFDSMLLSLAVERGAIVFSETRMKNANACKNGWLLECDEITVSTSFVIDATGRACSFAKLQGSNKIQFDDLHGIYTYWKSSESTNIKFGTTHTLVESGEHGWWYSALLPNGNLALAFMTDTGIIKSEGLKHPENYLQLLDKTVHTKKRIEKLQCIAIPSIKVANAYELDNPVGKNWMAVGDSASAFDPLSSYGIHKALQNGIAAGEAVYAALCGDTSKLKTYAATIREDFQQFLITRYQYYAMETRWQESPFWKTRQQAICVHPMQELMTVQHQHPYDRNLNRIISNEDIYALIKSCEIPKTAVRLVEEFQEQTMKKYPDWRVIQAVSYLKKREIII